MGGVGRLMRGPLPPQGIRPNYPSLSLEAGGGAAIRNALFFKLLLQRARVADRAPRHTKKMPDGSRQRSTYFPRPGYLRLQHQRAKRRFRRGTERL